MRWLSRAERTRILSLLVEGASLRSTSRLTGASINTVTRLLVDAGAACHAFHHKHVRNVRAQRIQADEIWSFTYCKDKTVGYVGGAARQQAGAAGAVRATEEGGCGRGPGVRLHGFGGGGDSGGIPEPRIGPPGSATVSGGGVRHSRRPKRPVETFGDPATQGLGVLVQGGAEPLLGDPAGIPSGELVQELQDIQRATDVA